jgi:hypothetical protein
VTCDDDDGDDDGDEEQEEQGRAAVRMMIERMTTPTQHVHFRLLRCFLSLRTCDTHETSAEMMK